MNVEFDRNLHQFEYVQFNVDTDFFCFRQKNTLLGKFWSKQP